MIKPNNTCFTPHWFKYIDTTKQANYKLFEASYFKSFINHKPFNSKIKLAYFLDGIFYPTTTGMAYHVMNLLTALTSSGIDTYLFRCYRGWEKPEVYKTFKFNTICIDPVAYYGDLDRVSDLLGENGVNVVVLDTSEVVLLQGSYFKSRLKLKLIQDVPNVDPLISREVGLKSSIVKRQEQEILNAEQYVDIYWTKTATDTEELVKLGVPARKIKTCGVGVEVGRFTFRKREKLVPTIKALYLGNMYYPPNAGGLKILEKTYLKSNRDRVVLTIDVVGDGDIPVLSRSYPHLRFIGKQEDLASLLDKYDLAFACPAYGSGISLKILDYLASGIPTISNRVGIRGHSDEILNAVLVDNNEDFSDSVSRLIRDDKLCWQLSTEGRHYVEKYFDINKKVGSFLKKSKLI